MGKGPLEAFSDGVIAIILTIMVLSLIPFVTSGSPALSTLPLRSCGWFPTIALNG